VPRFGPPEREKMPIIKIVLKDSRVRVKRIDSYRLFFPGLDSRFHGNDESNETNESNEINGYWMI
jgi:hypothetical protein